MRQNRWIVLAACFHVSVALVLVPVASHPFDLSVLTGNAEAWLRWGMSPFYQWKFGLDYALLTLLAQALRAFFSSFGMPGVVAIHVAWKLPLVAANLLSAAYFYRLGLRFAPDRAVLLASLWLLNPVVLWASAGHGQIESTAILSLLASLDLALSGHLLLAGFVTGLGTGIEYFPLVAAIAIFLWNRAGILAGRRPVPVYGLGVGIGLLLCFAPLFLDPVARAGLIGGLVSSGGLDQNPVLSNLSVWAWLGPHWAGLWPWLFVTSVTAFLIAFARTRSSRAGMVLLSGVLTLALVWDSNTLPQFAVIGALALWLLALATSIEPVFLVGVPAAGLASYFFFLEGGDANSFFFDELWRTASPLWPVPHNASFSAQLGRVFVAGMVGTFVLGLLGAFRPPRVSGQVAVGLGMALSLTLAIWAAQPAIWRAIPASSPSDDLPAFEATSATRLGAISAVAPDALAISYPTALLTASEKARTKPRGGLKLLASQAGQIPELIAHRRLPDTFNGQPVLLTYQTSPGGSAYAVGLPPINGILVFNPLNTPLRVSAAVLRWPTGPSDWLSNWALRILGLSYGVTLIAASVWGFWRLIGRPHPDRIEPSLQLRGRKAAAAVAGA